MNFGRFSFTTHTPMTLEICRFKCVPTICKFLFLRSREARDMKTNIKQSKSFTVGNDVLCLHTILFIFYFI